MTDAIKKCSDCKHAVPAADVGDKEWEFAKCHQWRSRGDDDGSKWHLGLSGAEYAHCSTMRSSLDHCGKAAQLFEPREPK